MKNFIAVNCNGAGGMLYTSDEWQELHSPNYPNHFPDKILCTWLINRDNNTIEIRFNLNADFQFQPASNGVCDKNFIEIKLKKDKGITGGR